MGDVISYILIGIGIWFVLGIIWNRVASTRLIFITNLTQKWEDSSTPEASMARLFGKAPRESEYIPQEIYGYCMSDSSLKGIVVRYRATEEDFRDLFMQLVFHCGFYSRSGKYFIPIASFVFPETLEYILKNKNIDAGDNYEITRYLMSYFDKL